MILEQAKGQLEGVVLCGWGKDGELYFGSTYADGAEVLYLLESCKHELMHQGDDEE
jgi:hypothetical protein